MHLAVDPDAAQPPFEQVRSQITEQVRSGQVPPGTRLPPVRALAQELGLATRDLTVELRVAQEAATGAVLAVLGRLALAVELLVAHPARTAGDVEGDDDAVADRHLGDLGADLLDDAHRLVPDDVAGLHERGQRLVQVQVRAAESGRGDANDDVRRFLDARIGDLGDLHVVNALPSHCLH